MAKEYTDEELDRPIIPYGPAMKLLEDLNEEAVNDRLQIFVGVLEEGKHKIVEPTEWNTASQKFVVLLAGKRKAEKWLAEKAWRRPNKIWTEAAIDKFLEQINTSESNRDLKSDLLDSLVVDQ
jgi:uncharacterized protein YifE (UPF0438 family)